MFIGNIPNGITDQDLRERFKEFGAVETGYIVKDHRTGDNSNFGYVVFKDAKVLKYVLGLEVRIYGKVVSCQKFKGKK